MQEIKLFHVTIAHHASNIVLYESTVKAFNPWEAVTEAALNMMHEHPEEYIPEDLNFEVWAQ